MEKLNMSEYRQLTKTYRANKLSRDKYEKREWEDTEVQSKRCKK